MPPTVNIAIQVLPKVQDGNVYAVVDKAIEAIAASGVSYRVCPFETVMEGSYDKLMAVVESAQQACFAAGASEVLVNLKIQRRPDRDVTMAEKIDKYDAPER
jgi:uncharacterized protein (TIGR00106 family)